jgi:hypothetical protein
LIIFEAILGSFDQDGISPQRSWRAIWSPSLSRTIATIGSVGAML